MSKLKIGNNEFSFVEENATFGRDRKPIWAVFRNNHYWGQIVAGKTEIENKIRESERDESLQETGYYSVKMLVHSGSVLCYSHVFKKNTLSEIEQNVDEAKQWFAGSAQRVTFLEIVCHEPTSRPEVVVRTLARALTE